MNKKQMVKILESIDFRTEAEIDRLIDLSIDAEFPRSEKINEADKVALEQLAKQIDDLEKKLKDMKKRYYTMAGTNPDARTDI